MGTTSPLRINATREESITDEGNLPTPPLQPLEPLSHSVTEPPFSQLQSPPPFNSNVPFPTTTSIPLDCQQLSEQEKRQLVKRNQKLNRLLGTTTLPSTTSTTGGGAGGGGKQTTTGPSAKTPSSSSQQPRPRPISLEIPSLALGKAIVNNNDVDVPGSPNSTSRLLKFSSPSHLTRTSISSTNSTTPSHLSTDSTASSDEQHTTCPSTETIIPTSSSTKTYDQRRPSTFMHRSSSTPSHSSSHSDQSSITSPEQSNDDHRTFTREEHDTLKSGENDHPSDHQENHHREEKKKKMKKELLSLEDLLRDERRKKLEKVRRVLGDRVPIDLVCHDRPDLYHDPLTTTTSSSSFGNGVKGLDKESKSSKRHSRELYNHHEGIGGGGDMSSGSKPRYVGERLREVFYSASTGKIGGGGGGGNHQHQYSQSIGGQTQSIPGIGSTMSSRKRNGSGKGGGGGETGKPVEGRENFIGTQSAPAASPSSSNHQHRHHGRRPQTASTPSTTTMVTSKSQGKGGEGEGMGRTQGVEALTKARKLESLFGDLPPQSLYLSPPSSSSSHSSFLPQHHTRRSLLLHRRSHSDLGTASSPSSTIGFSPSSSSQFSKSTENPLPSQPQAQEFSDDYDRTPLHRSRSNDSSATVETYRQSIASLRYVIENEPQVLDELAERVYSTNDTSEGEEGVASAREEEEKEKEEEVFHSVEDSTSTIEKNDIDQVRETSTSLPISSGSSQPISQSSQHEHEQPQPQQPTTSTTTRSIHHQVRQAQKLSSFFGTTRGQVWERLLDDLKMAVVEDRGLEEEERKEIMVGLERLRKECTRESPHSSPTVPTSEGSAQQKRQQEELKV